MFSEKQITKIINEISYRYVLDKTDKWSRGTLKRNLTGMCAISSFALHRAILIHNNIYNTNYKPEIKWNSSGTNEHCYVESNGKICDSTYHQFYPSLGDYRLKKLRYYFGDKNELYNRYNKLITNSYHLIHYRGLWSYCQTPTEQKIEWFIKELLSGDYFKLTSQQSYIIWNNRDKFINPTPKENESICLPNRTKS